MINGSSSTTNYHHNYIYNVDGLQQINTEEGRVLHDPVTGDFDHQYFIKDHLGNVRVVFGSPAKHQEKVLEQHHYYPYGMEFMGLEHGTYTLSNKYRFQGKELQDEHNLYWHDFGARMYDNQLGRWHCADPAEQFNSPYLAMGNNPVNMIDPNGMVSIGFRAWWIDYVNATGDCANLWYLQSQEVDRLQNLALQVSIYEMGLEEEQQDSGGGMGSSQDPFDNPDYNRLSKEEKEKFKSNFEKFSKEGYEWLSHLEFNNRFNFSIRDLTTIVFGGATGIGALWSNPLTGGTIVGVMTLYSLDCWSDSFTVSKYNNSNDLSQMNGVFIKSEWVQDRSGFSRRINYVWDALSGKYLGLITD